MRREGDWRRRFAHGGAASSLFVVVWEGCHCPLFGGHAARAREASSSSSSNGANFEDEPPLPCAPGARAALPLLAQGAANSRERKGAKRLANADPYGKAMSMKSITIGELHEHTEEVVLRMAEEDGLVITTRGQPVAILRPARGPRPGGKPLPKREPSTLPTTPADSTVFISEERGAR